MERRCFESGYWRRGLIFTIYFNGKSPFHWKRQFIQLREFPYIYPYTSNGIVRFAEEVAEEIGNFKYGVRVDEGESNEPLYDEDPFLICDLFNMTINGEEIENIDANINKVVIIDTYPIKITDFSLNEDKKKLLVLAGKVGALEFLSKCHADIPRDKNELKKIRTNLKL